MTQFSFVPEVTVAAADAGLDFTTQNKIPAAVIHTGGGVIAYTDKEGVSRTLHADAGRAYPVTIRTITGCTGEGYLQFFPDAAKLPGAAGPPGAVGPESAVWQKIAADAAAGTATAESPFYRAPRARVVTSLFWIPGAVLTAHDTTYATITVSVRNASGTTVGTLGSFTTKITGGSGDWVAFDEIEIDIDTDYDNLAEGYLLTVAIAKASTGVAVPLGCLVANFDE